jgi:hypothetical protein
MMSVRGGRSAVIDLDQRFEKNRVSFLDARTARLTITSAHLPAVPGSDEPRWSRLLGQMVQGLEKEFRNVA